MFNNNNTYLYRFVIWRKSNKIAIKLVVTPNDNLCADDDVVIGFSMQYTYVNTVTNATERSDPQKHALTTRVYVNVGKIIQSGSS